MTDLQKHTEKSPEAFAALLASKCAPGVVEKLVSKPFSVTILFLIVLLIFSFLPGTRFISEDEAEQNRGRLQKRWYG